jgi:hypothetical protein
LHEPQSVDDGHAAQLALQAVQDPDERKYPLLHTEQTPAVEHIAQLAGHAKIQALLERTYPVLHNVQSVSDVQAVQLTEQARQLPFDK